MLGTLQGTSVSAVTACVDWSAPSVEQQTTTVRTTDVLTCEDCGCLVDPEATEIHEKFHADLVKKSELTSSALANRHRTKFETAINTLDC